MKKLLKEYGLNSDMQYFEMIVQSCHNGQLKQAVEQFRAMPRSERLNFLKAATVSSWSSGLSKTAIEMLFDYGF